MNASHTRPTGESAPEAPWLTAREQVAWRKFVAVLTRLPAALDTQLQQDSRLTHFDYFVLSALSEASGRRMRLRDLAQFANASLSRLSHVVTKLEKNGWVRRENVEGGRGSFAVLLDDGYDVVVAAAPGHVAAVQAFVFGGLTEGQVTQLGDLSAVLLDKLDAGIARGLGRAGS